MEGGVTTAPELYRAMLRDDVGPALRDIGLKGSGSSYQVGDDRVWTLLQFQSSIHNSVAEVRFTVNLAVIGKAQWVRAQEWWLEQWPGAKPLPPVPSARFHYPGEASFAWRRRIGHIMPANDDAWWVIDSEASVDQAADLVVAAVRDHGMPALLHERDRVASVLPPGDV
jgi:hypothetical protein